MMLLEAVEKVKNSKKQRQSLEICHKKYDDVVFTVTERGNLHLYWDSYYKMDTSIIILLDNDWYVNDRNKEVEEDDDDI